MSTNTKPDLDPIALFLEYLQTHPRKASKEFMDYLGFESPEEWQRRIQARVEAKLDRQRTNSQRT
jgi:hypothetical protein